MCPSAVECFRKPGNGFLSIWGNCNGRLHNQHPFYGSLQRHIPAHGNKHDPDQEKDYALLSLLMLLCVVADWLMLKAMKRLRAVDEEKHKAIFLEQQVRQQQSYYMHVRQEAEETSRLRHDMRNAI